ncbi:MAG: tetratricopeptide repeat-containing glycosyltransferase family 2 protein [Bacillota bacterium]
MADQQRISLCLIARDEEANLERCLASAAGLVDEIILVDTGSVDGTVQVAERHGARVLHHRWTGDFAAARNRSLEAARGEWILWLDADEELSPEGRERIRPLVAEAGAQVNGFGLIVASWLGRRPGGHLSLLLQPRLFRHRPHRRFAGRIHEWIDVGPVVATDLRIYHYGYLSDPVLTQRKAARNIAILSAELERRPDDAHTMAQLGAEYLRLGDSSRGAELLLGAWQRERSYLYADRAAHALLVTGRCQEARSVAAEGLERWPDYTDLHFYLGCAALELSDWQAGRAAFRRSLEMGPAPHRYRSLEGHSSFLAWYHLAQAECGLHNWEAAVRACWQALTDRPDFTQALPLLVEALVGLAGPEGALAVAGAQMRLDGETRRHLAGAFGQLGCWRQAQQLLEQAGPLPPADQLLLADSLLALGRPDTALERLEAIAPPEAGSATWVRLQTARALAGWLTGREDVALASLESLARERRHRRLAGVLRAFHRRRCGEPVALRPTPYNLRVLLNLIEKLLVVGDRAGVEQAIALLEPHAGRDAVAGPLGRLLARWGHPGALPHLERAPLQPELGEALLAAGRPCPAARAFASLRQEAPHRLRATLGYVEAALRTAAGLLDEEARQAAESLAEEVKRERHRPEPVHDRPQ